MRALAASLLLLLLPGLLLPAGAALRVCLCAWHGVAPNEGCRAATAAVVPGNQGGCARCRAQRRAEAEQPVAQQVPHTSCHCVIVDGPSDPMQGSPPSPPAQLAVAVTPEASPFAVGREAKRVRAWPPAHDRPPPPGHQRNLPLRL